MPPIHGCKFLFILAMTQQWIELEGNPVLQERQLVFGYLDVKRAHFVAPSRREVYLELPSELQAIHGWNKVARLLKSFYGMRDAGANWEFTICEVLVTELEFVQGASSPCHYWHPVREIRVTVHGDDFTSLGTYQNVLWLHQELHARWMVEVRGILGPPRMPGTVQEIRHLNRLICWDDQGLTWEPDPRHVDLLCQGVVVTGAAVSTPLVKEKIESLDVEDELLQDEAATAYRSHTMRAGYLA